MLSFKFLGILACLPKARSTFESLSKSARAFGHKLRQWFEFRIAVAKHNEPSRSARLSSHLAVDFRFKSYTLHFKQERPAIKREGGRRRFDVKEGCKHRPVLSDDWTHWAFDLETGRGFPTKTVWRCATNMIVELSLQQSICIANGSAFRSGHFKAPAA